MASAPNDATEPTLVLTPPDPVPEVRADKAAGLVPVDDTKRSELERRVDERTRSLAEANAAIAGAVERMNTAPLRRLGITANGGQDDLKGKILRIAHCGYFGAFDILTSLSGLEIALQQLGHEVDHGAGVGAAQRVFVEAGVLSAA